MAGLVPALALLLAQAPVAAGLPAGEPALETETFQTRTDREDRMTVPVSIDGQGPYRFLIDTGSQRTVLANSLAEELALKPGPEVRIISQGGIDVVPTAYLDEFRLGQRTYRQTTVPLLKRQNMQVDGIIGTDSLQDHRVMMDFGRDTIEIGSPKSLGGTRGYEIVVTARRRQGQLIMTNARLDGVKLTVIVDTGAGVSVGNRALQRALTRRGNVSGPITLTSVTGHTIVADLGFASKLDIREFTITGLVVAFTDTPAFRALELERQPALFLGMRELRLFDRVAIDFPKRRVLFDLPPKG